MVQVPSQSAAVALNRFGLGARPDEAIPTDPRTWLIGQFDRFEVRPAALAALPPPGSIAAAYRVQVRSLMGNAAAMPPAMAASDPKAARGEARDALRVELRDTYRQAINARMTSALVTPAPFVERLATFWSNHFALSIEKPQVAIYAPYFELEAIRPHVMGRFEDMVLAADLHPAMLLYLDQNRSTGPNSARARSVALHNPDKKPGLNENLAREIMELHTLGVRSGYTQADVTEFARVLTGWTVQVDDAVALPDGTLPQANFRPPIHEPGNRTLLGKSYPEGGQEQSIAVLRDLAGAPATARHIATKLVRHFVADDPPPAAVDRVAAAFLRSRGDLPTVYRALIDSPEAWAVSQAKFKTPWEWTASTLRGLGRRDVGKMDVSAMLTQLGQPTWRPGQPIGWDDIASAWAAPDALMRRVELAQRFATGVGDEADARTLAPKLLPGTLTPATATALAQAESAPTALVLLLVSPEFQRR